MMKKNRTIVSLQSSLLIVMFIALGMFWKDQLFPCLLNFFAWCFVIFFVSVNTKKSLLICIPIVEAFVCNLYVFSAYAAFGPFASESAYYAHLLAPSFMKVLVLFLAVPAIASTVLAFTLHVHKTLLIHLSVLTSLIFPGYYASSLVCDHIRETAIYSLVDHLNPLVYAIEAFNRDNGYLPGELSQLVPKYISSVPKSNLYTLPQMDYAAKRPPNWTITLMSPYNSGELLLYNSDHEYGDLKGTKIRQWLYVQIK